MRARAETDTVGEMVEDAVKDDVKDAEIVADIVWVMESTVAVAFADVVAVADAVADAVVVAVAVADAVAAVVAVANMDDVDVIVDDTVSDLLGVVEMELVTDIDCVDVILVVADFVGSTNEMFEDDADTDGVNVGVSDTVTDGVAVEAFEGDAEIDGENVVVGELDLCGEFVDIGDDVSSTNETLVDDADIEYVDVIVGELEPDTVSDPDDEVE